MPGPLMDILASRSFPELAQGIRSVADRVMKAWEQAVRQSLPAADRLSHEQLRDDLPSILEHTADSLESARYFDTEALSDAAPRHGAVRYDQGFNLNDMMIEYGLLRLILVSELTQWLDRRLDEQEILALGAASDITLRRAVVRFVDHLSRELKTASEAHSKYLSFLSHDLRGGLNGVFLMIEVLKRELAGESRLTETVQDLDAMRRTLLETVGTMDRFLHAERFRKGKIQVRPGELSLKSLVAETVNQFAYQAREKGVELAVDVSPDCQVVSDKDLLMLIVQNFLSNSIKYSEAQTTVSVKGECLGESCRLSFIDQGPGIAPDKLDGLFDAFSRGETHGQPGMGLGLTIAQNAAKYLSAKLWVESEVGKGSMFVIEIPRELKVRPPEDQSQRNTPLPQA